MKKIIIIVIVAILIFLTSFIVIKNINSDKKENKKIIKNKIECNDKTGGSFIIKFETNGGEEFTDMHVCIACSPDSYLKLPIPKKDKKVFKGWYYDSKLKDKVEGDSSLDVKPKPIYDENGCFKDYDQIILYASWSEK